MTDEIPADCWTVATQEELDEALAESLRPFFGAALEAAAPKILEQVRATVAAKAASPLCGCCRNIIGRPPTPAVALWTGLSNHTVALCQSCLDIWLDDADDDAELEPSRVQWLDGSRTLAAANAARSDEFLAALANPIRLEPRATPIRNGGRPR